MGATQLAQTPRGTPATAPSAVSPTTLPKRRRGSSGSSVSMAAPKNRLKVMPMRLVHIQLTVVRRQRHLWVHRHLGVEAQHAAGPDGGPAVQFLHQRRIARINPEERSDADR